MNLSIFFSFFSILQKIFRKYIPEAFVSASFILVRTLKFKMNKKIEFFSLLVREPSSDEQLSRSIHNEIHSFLPFSPQLYC